MAQLARDFRPGSAMQHQEANPKRAFATLLTASLGLSALICLVQQGTAAQTSGRVRVSSNITGQLQHSCTGTSKQLRGLGMGRQEFGFLPLPATLTQPTSLCAATSGLPAGAPQVMAGFAIAPVAPATRASVNAVRAPQPQSIYVDRLEGGKSRVSETVDSSLGPEQCCFRRRDMDCGRHTFRDFQ